MASEWDDCGAGSDLRSNSFRDRSENNNGDESRFRRGRGDGHGGQFGSRNKAEGFQGNKQNGENGNGEGEQSSFNGHGGRGGRGGRGGGGCRGGGGGRGGDRVAPNDDDGSDNRADGYRDEKPKEFYIPPDPPNTEAEIFSQGIASGINFSKYDKAPVKMSGENCPQPISSFKSAGLADFLTEIVDKCNYKEPTPIQKTAIPVIMSKRDVMACAQTGSGKIAAFILPILHTLLTDPRELTIGKPQAVIISPTRELTSQIYNEFCKFALRSTLKMAIAYGGTASRHQSAKIANGCHVLVATPGRLHDFVDKTYISFEEIRFVVLDEADRMLDMGFMPAVEKMMQHPTMVPMHQRQTLMFSATFPEDIQTAAGKFLQDYIFITIGIVGGACADVEQTIFEVRKFEKRDKLSQILNEADPSGTIVFVETKRDADFLASFLSETTHATTSIHGDREQKQREEALADFKSKRMKILIATSVAARGLDIKNVNHVINYNLPKSIDEYVHRIGRTGRVGNRGRATSFFDPDEDHAIAADLKKILEQAEQVVPPFLTNSSGGTYGGNSSFGGRDVRRNIRSKVPALQEEQEEW